LEESDPRSHICLALDTSDLGEAIRSAASVAAHVGWVKVGLQLYTAYGPRGIRALADNGQSIFLDLKFHDIPETVASAVREVAALGVAMLNVHATGGRRMMASARQAAEETAEQFGRPMPRVIAVTILTSLSSDQLVNLLNVRESPTVLALRLARAAQEEGLAGVVASPLEAQELKAVLGDELFVVTPGIRLVGDAPGEQQRLSTPETAVRNGSDLVVVGRSILAAADPSAAAARVHEEVARGLAARGKLGA
jgi:orotidine-5'-phosphate decarboxylase